MKITILLSCYAVISQKTWCFAGNFCVMGQGVVRFVNKWPGVEYATLPVNGSFQTTTLNRCEDTPENNTRMKTFLQGVKQHLLKRCSLHL